MRVPFQVPAECMKDADEAGGEKFRFVAASFGYDPLKCPCCGETMSLLDIYFKHKRVPLEEMYEKAMSKARGCRSPAHA